MHNTLHVIFIALQAMQKLIPMYIVLTGLWRKMVPCSPAPPRKAVFFLPWFPKTEESFGKSDLKHCGVVLRKKIKICDLVLVSGMG